jgi:hypothetical protein
LRLPQADKQLIRPLQQGMLWVGRGGRPLGQL